MNGYWLLIVECGGSWIDLCFGYSNHAASFEIQVKIS